MSERFDLGSREMQLHDWELDVKKIKARWCGAVFVWPALLAAVLGGCATSAPPVSPPRSPAAVQAEGARRFPEEVFQAAIDAEVAAPRHRLVLLKTETIDRSPLGTTEAQTETRRFSPYGATVLHSIERRSTPNPANAVSLDVSFLGLINLQGESRSMGSFWRMHLTSLDLRGDWRRMQEGARLEVIANIDGALDTILTKLDEKYPLEMTCLVAGEVTASGLHPELLGIAKRLDCSSDKPQPGRKDAYYYLEDYAFAVRLETAFGSRRPTTYRIAEVRQE
jgi:hypothetical protein